MNVDFAIKQFATLPVLEAVLKRNGSALALANATVKLVLRPRSNPSDAVNTKILNAVVDDDGVDEDLRGLVHYAFTAVDTALSAEYLANWHVKYADNSVEVVPTIGSFIVVIEEAPNAFP